MTHIITIVHNILNEGMQQDHEISTKALYQLKTGLWDTAPDMEGAPISHHYPTARLRAILPFLVVWCDTVLLNVRYND
jgi:hypothetical protein